MARFSAKGINFILPFLLYFPVDGSQRTSPGFFFLILLTDLISFNL
ncbi:hypothetical protein LEP1GSC199_3228 [Leptospira vanthielii serovar Holland str. Waz Holland = ATCC 700522]|uniref:Uncharacterized protein n=1 Tax=Leptospira vanthielii serovar Holland str. Waz Holland = ATCC 700522 TaxID=1218591 RepID=N1WEA4_9LEPT|nr:hypothetical protein LEP1GSC199_3228 [Leptospira vanthielii serovar Holland str. Waz Holland = ATCC 700522]